ncbi:MAG: LytTR family DNA-binding domain-containing protein [Pseudomonadota bacterium]
MNRHVISGQHLASPRNLRLGALVLLLVAINQINDPLMDATMGQAFVYWVIRPLVLACGLWLADQWIARLWSTRWSRPDWLKPVVLVSAIGLLPFAVTEALLEQFLPFRAEFLDDGLWSYSPLLAFLGEYATAASIVVPLHLLLWLMIDKQSAVPAAEPTIEPPPVPEFLKLATTSRPEDVLALQADEHYVRIYSRDGAELVHYRFSDAIAEMSPELGLQVHRSWWVAASAVRSAQRGSRRWQLELETDVSVPVSDSFIANVRERGWLKKKRL